MLATAPARERGAGEVDKEASSVATEEDEQNSFESLQCRCGEADPSTAPDASHLRGVPASAVACWGMVVCPVLCQHSIKGRS